MTQVENLRWDWPESETTLLISCKCFKGKSIAVTRNASEVADQQARSVTQMGSTTSSGYAAPVGSKATQSGPPRHPVHRDQPFSVRKAQKGLIPEPVLRDFLLHNPDTQSSAWGTHPGVLLQDKRHADRCGD